MMAWAFVYRKLLMQSEDVQVRAISSTERFFLWFAGILGACIVSFYLYFCGVSYLGGADEQPPQDNDLRIAYLNIPEKENAFYFFNQAAGKIILDKNDQEKMLAIIKDGKQYDVEFVNELLNRNKEVFDYIDMGLQCAQFQVPLITGFDTGLPYLSPWRKIARIRSMRALYFLKEGREKQAFDEAVKIIEFGYMIEDSHGAIVNYLVGLSIKQIGLERLRNMLSETTLDSEKIASYIKKLDNYRANEKGLADAFKAEYLIVSKVIDGLLAGKVFGTEGFHFQKIKPAYLFKPNKTKRMFAETYGDFIKNLPKNYTPQDTKMSNTRIKSSKI